jgi:hypothetical protein
MGNKSITTSEIKKINNFNFILIIKKKYYYCYLIKSEEFIIDKLNLNLTTTNEFLNFIDNYKKFIKEEHLNLINKLYYNIK